MAQPKKSKEEKHKTLGVTLHPRYHAMKDALLKEGINISYVVQKAIEKTYEDILGFEEKEGGAK